MHAGAVVFLHLGQRRHQPRVGCVQRADSLLLGRRERRRRGRDRKSIKAAVFLTVSKEGMNDRLTRSKESRTRSGAGSTTVRTQRIGRTGRTGEGSRTGVRVLPFVIFRLIS